MGSAGLVGAGRGGVVMALFSLNSSHITEEPNICRRANQETYTKVPVVAAETATEATAIVWSGRDVGRENTGATLEKSGGKKMCNKNKVVGPAVGSKSRVGSQYGRTPFSS